ncbi:sulfotransferase [Nitrospirillum sp. BR 11828]|uniref:sulfotransferase family protein n=1 Tax=Nitrospirillum sp. BR 11828 TaxID=3104325 RepID=UPI002ACA86D8|nr:sulfotransferase [Nitrospirillum sp. BR 11828]MDZ5650782.1 sulfotransferase [Nitrospirillum sp. BR 11828]
MIGPNFLGIGAQKSGTTWIYENLSCHPHVRFPGGKEIHFWNARRDLGVTWWLDQFGPRQPGLRSGEITPAYATVDTDTIHAIHELCPDLRLFYVLRNPIDRAWSAARMAVLRAEMTLDEASEHWFLDHFRSAGSRRRGAYGEAIQRWRSVFPAEQLMVALFDDLQAQPRAFLSRLCGHIGIEAGFYEAVPEEALRRAVFTGPSAPLPPPLRRALIDQYGEAVETLGHLLRIDLSHWLAEP